MNKRTKIIVSISGIVLVALILLGLTYAYFLTRINGNTNTTSITVTTANLELVYGDGNGIINVTDKLLPVTPTNDNAFATKTFTVTNNGDATSYVVVIDETSVSPEPFESNDFRFKLTCTNCTSQVTDYNVFPINGGIILSNNIASGVTQTYTLKVWYIDTGINQSNDMNKTLTARVNIEDINRVNPYASGTLAYNIINNAMNVSEQDEINNGIAKLRSTPVTTPGSQSIIKSVKADDPTTFTSTRTNATNYYISYADDYTIDPDTGKFTLVNPTLATSKYTTSMASDLVGKYAVWGTSVPSISNTQNQSTIYKITTNVSEITTTIKYASVQKGNATKENTLSVAPDEYGTSYYYRGAVQNNYLTFNGMCWRIVRIEGDGSIKITLADSSAGCSAATTATDSAFIGTGDYGYTDGLADYENSANRDSSMKSKLNKFLNGGSFSSYNSEGNEITKTYTAWSASAKSKLKTTQACIGDTTNKYNNQGTLLTEAQVQEAIDNYGDYYYNNYVRLSVSHSPSFICYGTKTSSTQIFPLTADEVVYAGGKVATSNQTYYLTDNATQNYWWTLSPSFFYGDFGLAFRVDVDGDVLSNGDVGYVFDDASSVRPAVSLQTGTILTGGNGTKTSPYTVNEV